MVVAIVALALAARGVGFGFDRWNAAVLRRVVSVRAGWLTALGLGTSTVLASRWLVGALRLGGFEVRSGLVRFWLDSDRAGADAAQATLTRTCDVAAAIPIAAISTDGGLVVLYQSRATQQATVRYYVFAGGCVTYRLSFTRLSAPALVDQADRLLGFTARLHYVRSIRRDQGLTLCGAKAPPCPG